MLEGIGLPIPVEIPLSILGLHMAQGRNSYWQMVLLMWATTVVGNMTGYLIGYYGGRPMAIRLISWFRIRPEVWDRVEDWFHVHGLTVVIITRWINWGFAQNMWLCGITRVPFSRFFTVMVVNNLFWAMGWTWLALKAMRYLNKVRAFEFLHDAPLKVGLAALTVVAVLLLVWWLSRRSGKGPHQPPKA